MPPIQHPAEQNDPEIILRREFEREDQDDSRSLRRALLAALAIHAIALTMVLPAAEVTETQRHWICLAAPSSETYAVPRRR